jgi:hypothetical protein
MENLLKVVKIKKPHWKGGAWIRTGKAETKKYSCFIPT